VSRERVQWKILSREIAAIFALAIFLALSYNMFSPHALPLIRTQPPKEAVSDSALFRTPEIVEKPFQIAGADSIRDDLLHDTARPPKDIEVVAPLHEQALRGADSSGKAGHPVDNKNDRALQIISLDQMKRLIAAHRGVLLDARNADDYQKGHIRHARSMPAEDPDHNFPKLVEIPRDTLVIIYCNNPECHLGRTLVEFLHVMEFKNVVLYDEGWDGWIRANMPVDSTGTVE